MLSSRRLVWHFQPSVRCYFRFTSRSSYSPLHHTRHLEKQSIFQSSLKIKRGKMLCRRQKCAGKWEIRNLEESAVSGKSTNRKKKRPPISPESAKYKWIDSIMYYKWAYARVYMCECMCVCV